MENSVSIGDVPFILEQVFVHLPIASLNKCASVCKLWNNMVKVEKCKRREIFWMCKVQQEHETHIKEHCQCPGYQERKLDIGLHLLEVLQAPRSEPKLGIMFAHGHMVKAPHQYFRDCARVKPIFNGPRNKTSFTGSYVISPPENYKPFLQYVSKYLPHDCNMIILAVHGIIGTSADGSQVEELLHADGFASVFLPALPGLETFQFIFTEDDDAKINEINNEDNIPSITGIPKDKELKCLILFKTPFIAVNSTSTESVLKYYLQKQNYRLAVGSGRIPEVMSPQKSDTYTTGVTVGLAFAGEGIEAASVLIRVDEMPEQVFEKMHQMKTHGKFSDNSVAFMFSGNRESNEIKVIVGIFRKVFPRVPMLGSYLSLARGNSYCSGIDPEMDLEQHSEDTVVIILSVCQV